MPDPASLRGLVGDLTSGRGVDVAIELSGSSGSVQQQLDHLRIGGRCILVGTTRPTEGLMMDPERLTRSCWTLIGLHNYTPRDLADGVEFLTRHGRRYPFADLVERTFALEDAAAAFDHTEQSRALRVALRP